MTIQILKILGLAIVQNVAFTLVSRSRNRDNKRFHLIASTFSHTLWFLTFKELILADMSLILLIPYVIGSLVGSIYGMTLSMKIEKWLGATADGHINKQ
jgi:hypothetical protein